MIKTFIFSALFLGFFQVSAQWTTVGVAGFSNSNVSWPFIAIDQYGTPYITYCNQMAQATVMKFDGDNWVYVGSPGFSSSNSDGTNMTFDINGTPYVAYTDGGNNAKVSVMKFNGSNWVYVGTPGFTQDAGSWTSIAIDKNNTPYVAFRDLFNNYRASVMKYDGTNWEYIGTPGFSALVGCCNGASHTSLAIDTNSVLYVAYSDFSNNFKATVMKFDGSNWVYVGTAGFSIGQAGTTSIAIDNNGTPYVAYSDGANGSKATVMKFDGSNWIPVGSVGFTAGAAENTFISLDANGMPFVAYKDYANGQRASVMKFDGTNWIQLGIPGFSAAPPSEVYKTTLAIDGNGTAYVAYDDIRYDSTWMPTQRGATVMKYAVITGINEVNNSYSMNVFPNPTSRIITVNITIAKPKADFILKVTNTLGKTVYYEDLKNISGSFTKQINLSVLPKGIYFVELKSPYANSPSKKTEVKKIVLQ